MISEFDVGHLILMRKPHACGSAEWTVIRTGADVKIKCSGCSRIIMLDRLDFMKKAKKNLTLEQQKKSEGSEV